MMAKVTFTKNLLRFFPELVPQSVEGATVRQVLAGLEKQYPGLSGYLIHENGALRQHVNIFLDGKVVQDKDQLSDAVHAGCDIYIAQALSGG